MKKREVSNVGQEPRLFIKSPSYFLNISKMLHELELDESTSVYIKDGYFNEQTFEKKRRSS